MALTPRDRGYLEMLIDQAIKTIAPLMGIFRDSRYKTALQLKEENDYALGVMTGYVIGGFSIAFPVNNFRNPTREEMSEAIDILHKRTKEFRDAIFNQG